MKFFVTIFFLSILFIGGCKEESFFTTIDPPILEIRFKTKTSEYLPTDSLHRHLFLNNISSIFAFRENESFIEIFSDVKATARSNTSIDVLDKKCLDSSLIIGQSYVPITSFSRLEINIVPIVFSFFNGIGNNMISVNDTRGDNTSVLIPANIQTYEGRKTIITCELDLDNSIQRTISQGVDVLEVTPQFRISSIRVE